MAKRKNQLPLFSVIIPTKEHKEYKLLQLTQSRSTCFRMFFHEYPNTHSYACYVPNAYLKFLENI